MTIEFLVTSLIVIVSPGTGVLYTLAAVSYLTADYAGAERAVRRSLAVAPHELQSLELLHRVETAQAAHPHASPRQLTPPERMVR